MYLGRDGTSQREAGDFFMIGRLQGKTTPCHEKGHRMFDVPLRNLSRGTSLLSRRSIHLLSCSLVLAEEGWGRGWGRGLNNEPEIYFGIVVLCTVLPPPPGEKRGKKRPVPWTVFCLNMLLAAPEENSPLIFLFRLAFSLLFSSCEEEENPRRGCSFPPLMLTGAWNAPPFLFDPSRSLLLFFFCFPSSVTTSSSASSFFFLFSWRLFWTRPRPFSRKNSAIRG